MSPHTQLLIDAMASNDKPFFLELGKRIARLRQERNMTQQQLADLLGMPQQTLAHYEVGRSRVSVSMLPTLSEIFKVPIDELLGQPLVRQRITSKRGPPSQLERSFERINDLPKNKQKFVLEVLEAVLAQASG